MQNFRSSTAMVIELRFFIEMKKNCGNHVYLYFIPCEMFSSIFLYAVTFLHVPHLDGLRRQIETETESEN